MFLLFILLIVGPVVASRFIKLNLQIPMQLLQPTGQNNNDTSNQNTGSVRNGAGGAAETSGAAASSTLANIGRRWN